MSASGGLTPGQDNRGGQQPSPPTDETSWDAAGSIRDRLTSPKAPSDANSGGDSRGSTLSDDDFHQTDSRRELESSGRGVEQLDSFKPPEPVDIQEPRREDVDPAAAKSAERKVAGLFLLSLVGGLGFTYVYWFSPFVYDVEPGFQWHTPLLGLFMALALIGVGAGAVVWAKRLMVDEEAVQERHPFGSPPEERAATAAALRQGFQDTGLPRRKLLIGSLALGGGSLALLPLPFLFGLGPYADKEKVLATTAWKKGVRLIRQDGTPVKLGDLQIGGVESVFPDVPRGTKIADSPSLLIRMRPDELTVLPGRESWSIDGHIVYSSLCTHLGCPVKLYEQQSKNLLCPCHQSTFDAANGAEVRFGPASRPLPQLAISVDEEGYFTAQGDFDEPVGPGYWERSNS